MGPEVESIQSVIDLDGAAKKRPRIEQQEADEVLLPATSDDSACQLFDDQFSFFDGVSCESLLDNLFGGDATEMDESLTGIWSFDNDDCLVERSEC